LFVGIGIYVLFWPTIALLLILGAAGAALTNL
jgi:hypothetical protein